MKFSIVVIFFMSVFYGYKAKCQTEMDILSDSIYANISVAQSLDTINAHSNDPWFVILDVRTPSEYATKHLEKGVNLDFYLNDFQVQLASLNKSKTYLIHCAAGSRSGQVYTMMQNLHFKRVYNMAGGINAWSTAGYTTTTNVAPVLNALCSTDVNFNSVTIGKTDSTLVTITNSANSVCSFSGASNLMGTSFSTGFNINTTISGAKDYSFYIYYTPDDVLPDSAVFAIQSNGGTIEFKLKGVVENTTSLPGSLKPVPPFFNDADRKQLIFNSESLSQNSSYSLFDIHGRLIRSSRVQTNDRIDYSFLIKGIYFLRINTCGETLHYKMML